MASRRVIVTTAWAVVLVPLFYISSCSVISNLKTRNFDQIEVGNSQQKVLELMGKPSVQEASSGAPFLRYADHACQAPCAERYWFENRMSFDLQAWSVEFDSEGKVVRKARWTSP